MKTKLVAPPWGAPELTQELKEAVSILKDNVWSEASVEFYANRDAKIRAGKHAPKGMQQTINNVIDRKFHKAGWEGEAGYYFKNTTWIRITFRHQMSLGSDIIDALKVCKKECMNCAMICAANRKTLEIITPNDAAAIVSFEKLHNEIISLNGAIDIPLILGELSPFSKASQIIEDSLSNKRPRDVTIPSDLIRKQ